MKPKVALFIHQPKCSVQSANGIIHALRDHYDFKMMTRHELESDFFDDVDIVCFPGGFGDSDSYEYLLRENKKRIYDFLARGGRYLGICMGAYWAGHHYFDILNGVRVEQYIRRPNTDTRRPHAKACPINWMGEETKMYFYDCPAFVRYANTQFETIATYANGDPMAIIQDRIGLIGCHPEATKHWYDSYSWMRKEWTGGHYDYLLNFTNYLMTK